MNEQPYNDLYCRYYVPARSWDAFHLSHVRIIRAPDRRFFILAAYCTPAQVRAHVESYRPSTGH
jgi:hypothetical protein